MHIFKYYWCSLLLLIVLCFTCTSSEKLDLTPNDSFGIKITNILDTNSTDPEYITGYGFTCVVETPELTILLDTGDYGEANPDQVILHNMRLSGFTPEDIDVVFISHWHKGKGLSGFHKENSNVTVYAPMIDYQTPMFRDKSINYEIIDEEWFVLAEDIYSTGSMNSDYDIRFEQALVIDTDDGLIVIISCAHPGILPVLNGILHKFNGKNISLLMGGFHLSGTDELTITNIIQSMIGMGIDRIAPSHCSGKVFEEQAQEIWGENYIVGKAGLVYEF